MENNIQSLDNFCTAEVIDIKNHKIEASLFATVRSNSPKRILIRLVDLFGISHKLRQKKDGQAISAAIFKGVRNKANIDFITMIVLDFDDLVPGDLVVMRARVGKCSYVCHTSFSHNLEGPEDCRIRLIIPLSRPITAHEFEAIYQFIGGIVGNWDKACKDGCHIFYLPSAPADRIQVSAIRYVDGFILDVERILQFLKENGVKLKKTVRPVSPVARNISVTLPTTLFELSKRCNALKQLLDQSNNPPEGNGMKNRFRYRLAQIARNIGLSVADTSQLFINQPNHNLKETTMQVEKVKLDYAPCCKNIAEDLKLCTGRCQQIKSIKGNSPIQLLNKKDVKNG